MDRIDVVREDVLDGLVSGEAAQSTPGFAVVRQPDGSLLADFGDPECVFVVRVDLIARTE